MSKFATPVIYADSKCLPLQHLPTSIIDLALSRGVYPEKILRGSGIFLQDLTAEGAAGKQLTSPEQVIKLLDKTKQYITGYDSSFLLGQRLLPGQYGAFSQALQHATNLAELLKVFAHYQSLINPFIGCELRTSQQQLHLYFYDAIGLTEEQYIYLLEVVLTALTSCIKYLTNSKIKMHYQFKHNRPRYIQEYEENLGFNLAFDQLADVVSIDKTKLKQNFRFTSPIKQQLAMQQLAQTSVAQPFLQQIRNMIRKNRSLTLEELALRLDMSPASLKRKLKQHKTRFLAIQDQQQKEKVIHWLRYQSYTNEQLANKLGFNDLANFRRAFKRWFNMTPSGYKSTYLNNLNQLSEY
ncbi:AraC family transcriptional regulator [Catenovulum agarivorans DS-2]|uniref:AraC family transcriptional regulator n=1 Tax=Catenovulum agarivorans DS-2 TaxID=1328313 RepID=W7Q962_9ALTE|nr:AraC family transcriptional regulator [Catenovulum agarivorans]EWH09339.1 AraC family transcriptional regulator [Catenovulum agarivorans DS-2]